MYFQSKHSFEPQFRYLNIFVKKISIFLLFFLQKTNFKGNFKFFVYFQKKNIKILEKFGSTFIQKKSVKIQLLQNLQIIKLLFTTINL